MYAIVLSESGAVDKVYVVKGILALQAVLLKIKGDQGALYYKAYCNDELSETEKLKYQDEYDEQYSYDEYSEIYVTLIEDQIYTIDNVFDLLL